MAKSGCGKMGQDLCNVFFLNLFERTHKGGRKGLSF